MRYEEFGWKWSEDRKMVRPVWFTGLQVPPITKSRSRVTIDNVHDADDEGDGDLKSKGKRKLRFKEKPSKIRSKQRRIEPDTNHRTLKVLNKLTAHTKRKIIP